VSEAATTPAPGIPHRGGRLAREWAVFVRDPPVVVAAFAIAACIALFIVYPLVRVLLAGLQQPDGMLGLAQFGQVFGSRYLRQGLINSLSTGVTVAALSTALGFALAYSLARVRVPFKGVFHVLFLLPVISPPFVGGVATLMLFGFNGLVTAQLLGIEGANIYGRTGVVLSQVFTFFPIAYLTLRGVLEAIDPAVEDAGLNLGASRLQTFLRVTLPLAGPGLASALLIVFIESLADFGNPLVLAGSRFPLLALQAYLEITGSFNLPLGAALATVLLAPALTAFVIQKYWVSRRQVITVTGKPGAGRSRVTSPAMRWTLIALCWFVGFSVVSFYAVIFVGAFTEVWGFNYTLTLRHLLYVFSVGMKAVGDTLIVAITTTPLSGVFGMMVAFLVVRKIFPGRGLVEFTSLLNYAVPGTVVGIGYILAFNEPPLYLTGTLAILVLNFLFRYAPVGIQAGMAQLRQIDPGIEEAAANLGASAVTIFRTITLPLVAPAFSAALIFGFVRAMTAVSAAIFLVSASWNLMTVQILNEVGSGRFGVAAAFSVVLVAIVVVAVGLIRLIVPRGALPERAMG
jgi:iron(III) transport system permease protein